MRRGFYASTEFSFVVAGLAIIVMAWAANRLGVFSSGTSGSHGGMPLSFWFLLAAYVVTRMVAIWPIGEVGAVDPLGLISKAVEIATGAALVSLMWAKRAGRANLPPASPTDGS